MNKKITFDILSEKARNHVEHIISTSKNEKDLLFRLSGFYGGLTEVLKEDKPVFGKQYALTGKKGDKCIMNGNSWSESIINDNK